MLRKPKSSPLNDTTWEKLSFARKIDIWSSAIVPKWVVKIVAALLFGTAIWFVFALLAVFTMWDWVYMWTWWSRMWLGIWWLVIWLLLIKD